MLNNFSEKIWEGDRSHCKVGWTVEMESITNTPERF